MKLTAKGDFLVVEPLNIPKPERRVTVEGITDKVVLVLARVLSVGPGQLSATGQPKPLNFKVGDIVAYSKLSTVLKVQNSPISYLIDKDDPTQDAMVLYAPDVFCTVEGPEVENLKAGHQPLAMPPADPAGRIVMPN
jgi:co-chaperonin GroES (HSP10)